MWLYTKFGYFSIVRSSQNKENIMIRSRSYEHLLLLLNDIKPLKDKSIQKDYGTDYPYRIIIHDSEWDMVWKELGKIDYNNFKNEAKKYNSDKVYNQTLHDIWSHMFDQYGGFLQDPKLKSKGYKNDISRESLES
jgi:intein/homing endonuclease